MITYSMPLRWPEGREVSWSPRKSRFASHSLSECLDEIKLQLDRMGAESAELCADWSIGARGFPLTDSRNGGPVIALLGFGVSAQIDDEVLTTFARENKWARPYLRTLSNAIDRLLFHARPWDCRLWRKAFVAWWEMTRGKGEDDNG